MIFAADLGGTILKCALIEGGKVLAQQRSPASEVHSLCSALEVLPAQLDALCEHSSRPQSDCTAIALAFPGIVDSKLRTVLAAPSNRYSDAVRVNLPDWARDTFRLPLHLENDANAACAGEWQHGAARGYSDVVHITLGTGFGSSVVIRGHALRGRHQQAGVLGGHLSVPGFGRRCNCPNRGCVEAEAGSWSLAERARESADFSASPLSTGPIDYERVFEWAERDDLARSLRDTAIEHWGAAVTNLIHAYDPEVVVIGGGIMNSGATILPRLREYVGRHAWLPSADVPILPAALGESAALLGLYALSEQRVPIL